VGGDVIAGAGGHLGIAKRQADPLVDGGAFHHWGLHRGVGLRKQRHAVREGIHAQVLGLVDIPNLAAAVLGVIDKVQRQLFWWVGHGIELCHEALEDGNAAGAKSNQRDG